MPAVNPCGARPADWDAVIAAGLTACALPVVQNPQVPRSASSALKALGKVPSRKNGYGEAVGFPGWTTHVTTPEEIAQWRQDQDLGISIRLEHMIAVDCDVDDAEIAQGIYKILCDLIGEEPPRRTRADSARWLVAMRLAEGEQVLKSRYLLKNGECLEVLGKGQQFVAFGRHPKGSRYEWTGSPSDIPTITPEVLKAFTDAVVKEYGTGEVRSVRARRSSTGDASEVAKDSLYMWLKEHWEVRERAPGILDIRCPWESEHTSGSAFDGSTTYYCAGTGGYSEPAFICMHAHCEGRTIADLTAWAASQGYERTTAEDFADIKPLPDATPEEADEWAKLREILMRYMDPKTGSIQANLVSVAVGLQMGLEYCGFEIRQDTFTSMPVFRRAKAEPWQQLSDARMVEMRKCLMEERHFGKISRELMSDAILYAADQNAFDSMRDYLERTLPEWDGVDRITDFFRKYCGAKSTPYEWATARYMWTALYGRATTVQGIKADIVPVLVGKQGARKSTLVRVLAPREDLAGEISLETRDADLARQIRGKVVVEIPELVGMSKKDVAAVKYWISLQKDSYIQKYQERETVAPRRCLMMMTTNVHDFLTDPTGNRRFAPIEVGQIDIETVERDRLQLWAQAKVIFEKDGIDHRSVEQLSAEENKKYMYSDPWEEAVSQWLERESLLPAEARQPLTAAVILEHAIGQAVSRVSPADGRRLATVMGTLGFSLKVARVDGKPARIYQKKVEPKDDEDADDVPF